GHRDQQQLRSIGEGSPSALPAGPDDEPPRLRRGNDRVPESARRSIAAEEDRRRRLSLRALGRELAGARILYELARRALGADRIEEPRRRVVDDFPGRAASDLARREAVDVPRRNLLPLSTADGREAHRPPARNAEAGQRRHRSSDRLVGLRTRRRRTRL